MTRAYRPIGDSGRSFVRERGIATLVAMAFIAMLTVLVAEMTTNAKIEYIAAKSVELDMKAHFLARSAMNLSEVVIKVQTDILDRYRQQIGDIQLADYIPMFVGVFGSSAEVAKALGESVGLDTSGLAGLGLAEGEFDLLVSTDDGKINVNCANGSQATRESLAAQLATMLAPRAYDELFESRNGDDWERDRDTQVSAILDYIDRDSARFGADGTPEDYGYETMSDKYKPKNNYLDSTGELKLIRGIDDRFWTLFGSAFTVYGGCKQNVGAIQDVNVIASIIVASAKSPSGPVVSDPIKLWALAHFVAQARNLGLYFDTINTFADFLNSPEDALAGVLAGDSSEHTQAFQFPEGVEVDRAKLAAIARAGPRRTYRVEAIARAGSEWSGVSIEKRITGVWDTNVTRQNQRAQQSPKGAWVYWHEQ